MPDSGLLPSSTKWSPDSDLSPAERMALLSRPERMKLLKKLSTRQVEGLRWDWPHWARPSQLPPEDLEWVYWMMLAGRGSGKTRAGAEWIRKQKDTCPLIAL